MTIPEDAERVLHLWFGTLNDAGFSDEAHTKRWFMKDEAFDEQLRTEFGSLYAEIVADEHEDWLSAPRSALAYVIVLDQFSRNMFRGTPRMYAADDRAVAVVKAQIESGSDRQLRPAERVFLYMPLMHSERLDDQNQCVSTFERLVSQVDEMYRSKVENNVDYAKKHRDIVEVYGRFPHRNAILGRSSSAEEEAFLKKPGSSF